MRALEGGAGGGQALKVERRGIEAHAALQKRVAYAGVHYFVDVFLLYTAADGVEALRHVHGAQHGDVAGQAAVHRQGQALRGDGALRFEIRAVAQSVHPGVRPAAAGELHRVAADLAERPLKRFGDAHVVFLHLPAVVFAAVVAQPYRDVPHSP